MKTIVLVVLAAAFASQICQAIDNQSSTMEKRDLQSFIKDLTNLIKDIFHKTNPTIGGNSGRHSKDNEDDSKTEKARDLQSYFKDISGKIKTLFEKLNPFGGKDSRQIDTPGEEAKGKAEETKPARQATPVDEPAPAQDSQKKAEETKSEKTVRQLNTPHDILEQGGGSSRQQT